MLHLCLLDFLSWWSYFQLISNLPWPSTHAVMTLLLQTVNSVYIWSLFCLIKLCGWCWLSFYLQGSQIIHACELEQLLDSNFLLCDKWLSISVTSCCPMCLAQTAMKISCPTCLAQIAYEKWFQSRSAAGMFFVYKYICARKDWAVGCSWRWAICFIVQYHTINICAFDLAASF